MTTTFTGIFGSVSGTIIAGLLQPLENIKMALMITPDDLILTRNIPRNFARAYNYILLYEGVQGLFKGASASCLRAATGSFFYFSSLRKFETLVEKSETNAQTRNFLVSCAARIVSGLASNPISVIETRFQLTNFRGYSSIRDATIKIQKGEGAGTFYKGGLTSCYKEGAFAGLYYVFYRQFKDRFGYNKLTAGLLSGLLSTSITHPFEIARAKIQTQGVRNKSKTTSLLHELALMIKNGGAFKGLTPRLVKKPLSNALTFVMFQTIEELHKLSNRLYHIVKKE